MTTSKVHDEAYVWIWLPGSIEPIVAGVLSREGKSLVFNYGKSYLDRSDKISIFTEELPLKSGKISPLKGLTIAGCIRDGAPDAWGRRVLINRKFGKLSKDIDVNDMDELTFLLESGSDRIGALDFQSSPTAYIPRELQNATLEELSEASALVEKGVALSPALAMALQHGTAIGGARPKALIDTKNKKYIAKFSSTTDTSNVVKFEFIAMRLAKLAGLEVSNVKLTEVYGKDIILVERFDRVLTKTGWQRKSMISALTLFKLDEFMARYASYEELAEIVRHKFTNASITLKEIFQRLVFNILVGNTDDHARNHAAFWDGDMLTLTPAYDICPQARTGNEASQAMLIHQQDRQSRIETCLKAASSFLLTKEQALLLIEKQIESITANWKKVCKEAKINDVDRRLLQSRVFMNPFIFESEDEAVVELAGMVERFKKL